MAHWLAALKTRTINHVRAAISRLEAEGRPSSLAHHGVSEDEMVAAMADELDAAIAARLTPRPVGPPPLPPDLLAQLADRMMGDGSGLKPLPVSDNSTPAPSSTPPKVRDRLNTSRYPAQVTSPTAARKMKEYMIQRGMGQTEFAIQAGTTDKTIRKFLKTGQVKRSILTDIAKAMGISKEELLR